MSAFFYIANIRFPTERAHGIQVAKMCEALGENGAKVTLLVPDRKTFAGDPFSYYGTRHNFQVEKISVPDVVSLGRIGFLFESVLFAYRAAKRLRTQTDALIYTREELPLLFLPKKSAFYEMHQLRGSFLARLLLKRAKRIIVISNGLKEALVYIGYPRERVAVAHDGFDEREFGVRLSKGEARARLTLPKEAKLAMYIGGFEVWKGLRTLLDAARLLKERGINVAVIGGTEFENNSLSIKYPEVRFLGYRPYTELAFNQQAADVLVIPNSGRERISREFTSPLKLFAHMASGRPIVASRLPSLCEVLSDESAYLVPPNDPTALAEGIRTACEREEESERKAAVANSRVREFTWVKRAKDILA